ncbi:MAG: multidrug efflux SMR transporter [Bacillota bacterium]
MEWVYLLLAIGLEISATTLMKLSNGFTKILPTVGTFLGYALSFSFLSFALKKIEISVAYAIWSGVGIAAVSVIGVLIFKEGMNGLKIISLILIALGIVGLNLSGASR